MQALLVELAPPGDPWVEQEPGATNSVLLRSAHWAAMTSHMDVHTAAQKQIGLLNGALPLTTMGAQPLAQGGVYQYDGQGKRNIFMVLQTGVMVIGVGRVHATINGKMVPQTTGNLRQHLNAAQSDPMRQQLLEHLTQMQNWVEIYKAAETVRLIAGDQTALKKDLQKSGQWDEWDRCWRTANHHRHAQGGTTSLPPVPANESNARDIIRAVATRYL